MNTRTGQSGRRTKGGRNGRCKALVELDRMLDKADNQKAITEALEQELQANPLRFFRVVIMPLLPRDAALSICSDGVVRWPSSLVDGTPRRTQNAHGDAK